MPVKMTIFFFKCIYLRRVCGSACEHLNAGIRLGIYVVCSGLL